MVKFPKVGNKTLVLVFVVIIIAGAAVVYSSSDTRTGDKIKDLYELANPGTTVEVVSITQESGVYKMTLKAEGAQGTNYKDVFATKDGKILFESAIFVENSTVQMAKLKNFVDCLSGKNVRIFGVLNQSISPQGAQATALQLQELGLYYGKIYVSCDGQVLQSCVSLGIQQVPSVVYNNTIYSGAKTLSWFEQTTGCKL